MRQYVNIKKKKKVMKVEHPKPLLWSHVFRLLFFDGSPATTDTEVILTVLYDLGLFSRSPHGLSDNPVKRLVRTRVQRRACENLRYTRTYVRVCARTCVYPDGADTRDRSLRPAAVPRSDVGCHRTISGHDVISINLCAPRFRV